MFVVCIVILPGDVNGSKIEGDDAFRAGYLDFNGNPAWLDHFLYVVAPCEGGNEWGIAYYGNEYITRLQFNYGSWATAVSNTGLGDPYDPYHIGANVAWWSNNIEHPGGTGGWPYCWWVKTIITAPSTGSGGLKK